MSKDKSIVGIKSPYNDFEVDIDISKLMGDTVGWCYPEFFETEYFSNLMFYLKNLSKSPNVTVKPKNIDKVFQVFRDHEKMITDGDVNVVIIGSEVIDNESTTGRAFGIDLKVGERLPSIHPELTRFAGWLAKANDISLSDPFLTSFVDLRGKDLVDEGVLLLPASPITSTIHSRLYNDSTEPLTGLLLNMISELSSDVIFVLTDPFQEYLLKYINKSDNHILKHYDIADDRLFEKIDKLMIEKGLIASTNDCIIW